MIRRAYVIAYFLHKGKMFCMSGRENCIHSKALRELRERDVKGIKIDEKGADPSNQVGKNLGGVLLIGRTALPGGRVDKSESFADAAIRELAEEFAFDKDKLNSAWLEVIDEHPIVFEGSECRFYAMNLACLWPKDTNKEAELHCSWFDGTADDKRGLEIVEIDTLAEKLASADASDIAFIQDEMELLAKMLEPDSEEAQQKLADSLVHFQLGRSLQHQVDAVLRFRDYSK